MRNILLTLFLALSLTVVGQQGQDAYERGELLVMLEHRNDLIQFQENFKEEFGSTLQVKREISQTMPLFWFSFSTDDFTTQEALTFAERSRLVSIAQFNHTNVVMRNTPDDPEFDEQWSLFNDGTNGGSGNADIDALDAWDISTGGVTAFGDTIVVAVIDAGFNINHPDLMDNIFTNQAEIPFNGLDDDNNGYVDDINGWNVYNNSGTHYNDNHGSHVAGTIGATGDNGIGVTGVNWEVKLLPITGSGSNDAFVASAYAYVLDLRKQYNQTNGQEGAYVVSTNSSFGVNYGDPANYPLWCAMYDSLGYAGVLSAGATANLNINIDVVGDVPTACASNFLLSITNTTSSDLKNNSAAYGITTIDLGAPGTNIRSTLSNGYGNLTGTSMATPHVAGAVALMHSALCASILQAYDGDPAGLALYLKNKLMTEGVDQVNALSNNTVTGGRLNLYKAVSSVADSCFAIIFDVENTTCGDCDGSISANVVGGTAPYTYNWSNGSDSSAVDSICSGTYYLTVVDAVGDSLEGFTSVSDSAGPVVSVDKINVTCNGAGDGQVNLIGADAYQWSDGNQSSFRDELEVGTYYVSSTALNNPCTTIVEITISEPPAIVVNDTSVLPSPILSSNGSITLDVSGGTPPYEFQWSNGGTGSTQTGLSSATYNVVVTDDNDCSVNYEILLGYPTGIEDAENSEIKVFPNPTTGLVQLKQLSIESLRYEVRNVLGQILLSNQTNGENTSIDLSSFENGVYILVVEGDSAKEVHKIKLVK